jgi:putative hydrolase of the HAD superfamily
MPQEDYQVLLSDIGGVLGTNGWDGSVREAICRHFNLDSDEIAGRHRLMFDSYERGFMTFDEYIGHVFFHSARPFSRGDVRDFAYQQSVPWPRNIEFFRYVKQANQLKLGLISNEGEGITEYRVAKFNLRKLCDFMIISHFVHMRKPDPAIWQLALDLVQLRPEQAIYIDDRAMFVDIAAGLGLKAIHHVSLEETADQLEALGLVTREAGHDRSGPRDQVLL